jgi:hypothetical protein
MILTEMHQRVEQRSDAPDGGCYYRLRYRMFEMSVGGSASCPAYFVGCLTHLLEM